MLLIIYSFIIEILFLGLIKDFINNWEVAAIIFIGIHLIFVFLGIGLLTNKNRLLLSFAYIIRLIAMFWDIYGRSIFTFVGSGGDSEGFLRSAVYISNDLGLLKGYVYGGLYTKILGVISYITFPERILLQYLNVILGLFIILIIYKILKSLFIDEKVIRNSLIIISLFPMSIIHSAILLRENIISFFVILSLYYFIKWYKKKNLYNKIISMTLLGIASIFHSGVIVIAAGYIFAFLFYNHKKDEFNFKINTIIRFAIIMVIGTLIFTEYNEIFLAKFSKVEGIEDVLRTASGGRGRAIYLKWLKISNPLQLIIFSPIKMLYFLVSPLPTDWRGLGDALAFFMDGILYLYLIIYCSKYISKINNRSALIGIIMISLLVVVFVFGVGMNNAGTAMRHRNKIIPIFIIFYSLISDKIRFQKKSNLEYNKSKGVR